MSKLSKIGLFISIFLILLGIGISTAAFAMGASPSRITEYFYNRFHWDDDGRLLGLDREELEDWAAVEKAVPGRAGRDLWRRGLAGQLSVCDEAGDPAARGRGVDKCDGE